MFFRSPKVSSFLQLFQLYNLISDNIRAELWMVVELRVVSGLRVVAWHCEVIQGLWMVGAGSSRASSNGLLSVAGGSGLAVVSRLH